MNEKNALIPSEEEMKTYQIIAKKAAESNFFSKIGGEGGLLCMMLYARELGLPALQCLFGGMNNIQGKIEITPRLMNTMIRKAGHRLEIQESSETCCKIKGTRHDTKEEYSATFTLDEAKKAGLVRSGGGWEKYASDMLFARCLSRLARRLFADVISSSYVEGELTDNQIDHHVAHADRVAPQSLGNTEQLKEAEMVDEPTVLLNPEVFVSRLREKVGDKYSLDKIEEYLAKLEQEKDVPMAKIMEQALNPALMERFCRGWKKWIDSTNEPNLNE